MKKLFQIQGLRYIFFGVCTTAVNLISYFLLCSAGINITVANTIAVALAILFAYAVNKLFVFEHKTHTFFEFLREAGSFIGMRCVTMVIEVFGVLMLTCIWGVPNLISKLALQVIILILNYLISRFIVFKDGSSVEDAEAARAKRISAFHFLAGFLVTALIALAAFIILKIWPFGDKTLLIVDSIHQYLPFYTDFHEKLVNSESFLYSFSGGLGYNFWATYAYYLASPLNLLMAFIPTENVCDFMDLMILLKIAACGGCFSWYMHKRDEQRKYLPTVFGVMFALSNFIIGYYFNLMWLDSIAMLPLVMYGIEQITKGKSGKFFGISLFYGLWCNYYIGFMLCIFSCLYFIVCQIASVKKFRNFIKNGLKFAGFALLAGGMAAVVLLPAFMGLMSSESMESNTFPTTVKFFQNLAELLENHMAYMDPVTISSNQVGLNVYCGVSTVLLAVLYLFDREIPLRTRLAHYGLCALLLFSFACNIPNYIWHGFHTQNGLPNRFAFLYIAVLLIMAYDVLGHLKKIWLPELMFAVAVPVAFLIVRYMDPDREIEGYLFLISIGLLVLYFGVLLIGRYSKKIKPAAFAALLSGIMLIETASNAIHGFEENGSVTRSIYLADQTSYKTMMAEQDEDEDSFFRSEVDRQRMRNVTMFVGGNALVMFNSTMQSSVIDFCDALGIEARTNKNGYLGVTKLMNDVFGIKYVASPEHEADTFYQFEKVDEDGNLTLYKNDNALSLGFMVNDAILDWDTSTGEPLDIQNSFVELATGHEPIFVLDRYIDMEDGENYGIKIPDNKQVYMCIDTRVSEIDLNTPEYSKTFSDYTDHLYVINSAGENNLADFTVTLKDNQSSVRAQIYTCSNEAYQEVIDKLSESQLENVIVSDSSVTGEVDVKEAGTLLLTIPYDEGWKVEVDGKETDISCVGGALMGIHLEEGTHTISMNYTPQGLWIGSAISMISVILFMLSLSFGKFKKSEKSVRSSESRNMYQEVKKGD